MVSIIKRIWHLRQKPTLARANRASFTNEQWKGIRIKFIAQTAAGGIAFALWFLACSSYLFGTLYLSPGRHDNFHVLAIDYDGGVVGQAMAAAYQQLQGPSFFKLIYHSPEEFPTQEDMYHAVWEGKYWGAIAAAEGASDRLSAAIQGGEAATTYNAANALHYIWNQQRYTAFSNSIVQSAMQQLVTGTRIAYSKMNGTQASHFLNNTDPAAVQAFMNPISATAYNIQPAPFGSVILLNTVAMAMPVLQQFFFLLVLNGVAAKYQLYTKMTVHSSLLVRRIAGILFTFGAALCQTGYYWAFRENWNVNGNQFVLTWMTFWLLMHIHLLILDSISTIAPLPVMPFVVLLWVFLNIASTLSPLELQAGFYHWGIALPSHNAYSILITIWTGGSDNRLYRALPIMFAWWIVANLTTSATHIRACHLAYKFQQEEEGEVGPAKDEEEAAAPRESQAREPISRQTTIARTATGLERQRTVEEIAREQRQVYGPSVPPFA
ncbi:hypothetical protein BU26DRAFT_525534 [Trematosphaeria pertusa]|uniref:DUF3533 domain-containing protein n=1 Tax=Trematosphaeria pertusa TaxID=390896 RepID=A0A6A6HSX6_9PLEO|nr:uncharacterized protein BU26DRAFT_525534 [Trematosphaeria pertusa]KAF2240999.1 hypothetical protein BU26DRAFT_525534 [Trematosphaeria pertusa]